MSVIRGDDNFILSGNKPAVVTDTTQCNSSLNVNGIADSNLEITIRIGAYTCPAVTFLWKLASVYVIFVNLGDCMECLFRLLGLLGPS